MIVSVLEKYALSSEPLITAPSRQWNMIDIKLLSQSIIEELTNTFSNTSNVSARILVPTDEPAYLLASLVACYETGCTAIPHSENAGKGLAVLKPLLNPNALLTIDNKKIDLSLFSDCQNLQKRLADVILTTTGSTGLPKGVCLSLDQLILNALSAGSEVGIKPGMRWAIETDLALTSGLCHLLMAWLHGADFRHLRTDNDTDKRKWLKQAPFGFGGSPIQLSNLADMAKDIAQPIALMSSGDFLTGPLIKKIRLGFPHTRIHKFYGLTEVAGRFCALPADLIDDYPDAVGFPIKGTSLSVFRDDGAPVGINERGKVFLRSPLLMHGYLYIDGKFEPTLPNQWFPTGDEGALDSFGLLTLMGRADFSFKVGGEKADAYSIEQELSSLLGDYPYCVMPVPHKVLGQCAALFVECGGKDMPDLWYEAVSTVAKKLPARYVPMFGFVLPKLPRLPSGKINRMDLVQSIDTYEKLN